MFGNKKGLEEELRERGGVTARALVISAKSNFSYGINENGPYGVGDHRVVKLLLRVTPEGAPEFEAKLRQMFIREFPQVQESVEVIYDPSDHSRIAVSKLLGFGPTVDERRASRNQVVEQILRGDLRSDGTPFAQPEIVDELRKLVAQHDQGTLTEDAYQNQVAELFARS